MEATDGATARISIALLHYPVYDKNNQLVTTAVTNLDIHDIARAARTFGAHRYYVVTPVAEQQGLVTRILRHWQDGWGATYNPKRKEALDLVRVAATLGEALSDLDQAYGLPVRVVVTGANGRGTMTTCSELAPIVRKGEAHYLLVFGTGWGLADEIFDRADLVLEPIRGCGSYNHLSVRSAVAIILDRLVGERCQ